MATHNLSELPKCKRCDWLAEVLREIIRAYRAADDQSNYTRLFSILDDVRRNKQLRKCIEVKND